MDDTIRVGDVNEPENALSVAGNLGEDVEIDEFDAMCTPRSLKQVLTSIKDDQSKVSKDSEPYTTRSGRSSKPKPIFTPPSYGKVQKRTKGAKSSEDMLSELASERAIPVKAANFKFPPAFQGENNELMVGITVYRNSTGKLCWLSSDLVVFREMTVRSGLTPPAYNATDVFRGCHDRPLDTLITYIAKDLNLLFLSTVTYIIK